MLIVKPSMFKYHTFFLLFSRDDDSNEYSEIGNSRQTAGQQISGMSSHHSIPYCQALF